MIKAILLALLLLPLVSALEVNVYEPGGEPLQNIHFKISSPSYNTLVFLQNNTLSIDLDDGPVIITGSYINTFGDDYIYKIEDPDYIGDIYLLPAGTLRVKVYDKEGIIVPGANLMVGCGAISYSDALSDRFGGFEAAVPTGQCEITASKNGHQGSMRVNISQGEIVSDLQLVLDTGVFVEENWLTAGIIAIIIFGGASWYLLRKPKKKISSREKDIFETLNSKEKSVVQYLHNGESYQNKLGRDLSIPKTTLVRLIFKLEHKKIICVEKIGKTKKIRLSDWFLGQKER